MSKKAVVCFSGGLDSTTLLYSLKGDGYDVLPISVDYGQRHVRELESARRIARHLGIKLRSVDLSSVGRLMSTSKSSQLNFNIEVPEGHYEAENMKTTVVPNRNMMLLSITAAIAISEDADTIGYAAHRGDHSIYRDCRPEFVASLQQALNDGNEERVSIVAPFLSLSKTDIVRLAFKLEVPVGQTWSCYRGGQKHCGSCGTCVERIEAFKFSGLIDPVEYEINIDWSDCTGWERGV